MNILKVFVRAHKSLLIKNHLISLILIASFASPLEAKLLDKVVAVFNSKVFTLSQIERINSNLNARKNVSPQIYSREQYQDKDLIQLLINAQMIREKLTVLGYNVTDEQVEDQIKSTEKRLGVGRAEFMTFLKSNNISFEEYFEIIRETIEYNIFASRVISPLIVITEQQIKNTYFRRYVGDKAVAYKYSLTDYSFPANLSVDDRVRFLEAIKRYHNSGIIAEEFKNFENTDLDDIEEEGINRDLVSSLKSTDEGNFTKPILINQVPHVFYVKKKDLVESTNYLQMKEKIRNELFEESVKDMTAIWFEREAAKHYIKITY